MFNPPLSRHYRIYAHTPKYPHKTCTVQQNIWYFTNHPNLKWQRITCYHCEHTTQIGNRYTNTNSFYDNYTIPCKSIWQVIIERIIWTMGIYICFKSLMIAEKTFSCNVFLIFWSATHLTNGLWKGLKFNHQIVKYSN